MPFWQTSMSLDAYQLLVEMRGKEMKRNDVRFCPRMHRIISYTLICIFVNVVGLLIQSEAHATELHQGNVFTCTTVTEIPQIECEALVTFHTETGGINWDNNSNWLITSSPCNWYGITCSSNHVSKVELPENGLAGSIPATLKNLTNITHLNLQVNRLTGTIPAELALLTKLEELYLDSNFELSGTIPKDFGNLTNLVVLDLGANRLSGAIPSELGKLTNLALLDLHENVLTGAIPPELGNIKTMEALFLGINQLTDTIPSSIGELPNLLMLDLSINQLTGPIPPKLGTLGSLRQLWLDGNRLTGPIPRELGNLSRDEFVTLDLHDNQLSGNIPEELGNLEALYTVMLNHNQLTGTVPNKICGLPNLQELDLTYNRLSITEPPTPDCATQLNPRWMDTQTLPPADLRATAISSDTVRLEWTPIRYNTDSGFYEISSLPTIAAVGIITPTIHGQTETKRSSVYTVTNLVPDITYQFSIRTHTQQLELWSEPSESVSATPSSTFIRVQNEAATPQLLPAVDVLLYRGGKQIDVQRSDELGHVFFSNVVPGDQLVAMQLIKETPSTKALHDNWSYRTYLTNLDIDAAGTVDVYTIAQAGEQVLTVKKRNPLVLFNLVVSVEWDAYDLADANPSIPIDTFLEKLSRGIQSASNFLYDATDGQFAFGQVTVYDGGRHWDDADLQILASNRVRPSATVGGISATKDFTYTSTTEQITVFHPGYFRMGRAWNRFGGLEGALDQPDAFRTLVHEFAHYGLYLYDEYFYVSDQGALLAGECTSPVDDTNISDPALASVMDWHYTASEFAWQGENTPLWSERCKQTQQWLVHQESDWETIVNVYKDAQTPARWEFVTPQDRNGQPNPGPTCINPSCQTTVSPVALTQITIVPPDNSTGRERESAQIAVQKQDGALLPSQRVQLYLVKQENGDVIAMSDQGSTDGNGNIEVLGVAQGDILKAIYWDGSLFASEAYEDTRALVLSPTNWKPFIDVTPIVEETGDSSTVQLSFTISQTGALLEGPQVMLMSVGGAVTQNVHLVSDTRRPGSYVGTILLDPKQPAKEGHLWIRAITADNLFVETVTTYAIGGAPGSYGRAYPPIDPASSDGNFRIHIPNEGVPDNTLAIVMPSRGIPSLPDNLTVVGTPYTIRPSGGLTTIAKPSPLTMYYDQEAVTGIAPNRLRIYHWNEERNFWENKGGTPNKKGNFVSAVAHRFGIYAIVAEEASEGVSLYLPIIMR